MSTPNYSEYRIHVTTDPSYYGSTCTQEDADSISGRLSDLISEEFPGVTIVIGDGRDTGPSEEILNEIRDWVQEHWTSAL